MPHYAPIPMRRITHIVVHCTETAEGRDVSMKLLDRWDRLRSARKIGFHRVIFRDGAIHDGRPLAECGAHARGYNMGSIAVAYVGGLNKGASATKDTRTPKQKAALVAELSRLKVIFPEAKIVIFQPTGMLTVPGSTPRWITVTCRCSDCTDDKEARSVKLPGLFPAADWVAPSAKETPGDWVPPSAREGAGPIRSALHSMGPSWSCRICRCSDRTERDQLATGKA